MKTQGLLVPKSPKVQNLDTKVYAYLEGKGIDDCSGNMTIAILEKLDLDNFSPFRTIETEGMGEFMHTTLHLESLGLTCINKNDIEPLKGFDAVFVPDAEIA